MFGAWGRLPIIYITTTSLVTHQPAPLVLHTTTAADVAAHATPLRHAPAPALPPCLPACLQILRDPAGERYEKALATLGLTGPHPLVVKLTGPEYRCLDVIPLDLNSHVKLIISRVDRPTLAG